MTLTAPLCAALLALAAAPDAPKPAAQEVCPVMTGLPVEDGAKVVTYKGVRVLLCCDTCVQKWRADPEAYLIAKHLPQLAGLKLPPRAIAQVYCPVYRDRVVSAKDPTVTYKGVTVYLFNKAALKRWQADPEKYADPSLLPQLGAKGAKP